MNITGICTYETPCGWCSKWDKKIGCGNEKPSRGLRANIGVYDDYINQDSLADTLEEITKEP